MSIKKTLGGDRLGSGNKMQVRLHNYERSTHNLSRVWRSSMGVGFLTPCFVEPALNADTFEIDIAAKVRTLPTVGPLFASYKMQIDMFVCPIRLYQGLLHNNAVKIGLEMNKVLLPNMVIQLGRGDHIKQTGNTLGQFDTSCLLHYLGMAGSGAILNAINNDGTLSSRTFTALPLLMYWDIFKNYYSNKQEDNAYYVTGINIAKYVNRINIQTRFSRDYVQIYDSEYTLEDNPDVPISQNIPIYQNEWKTTTNEQTVTWPSRDTPSVIYIYGVDNPDAISLKIASGTYTATQLGAIVDTENNRLIINTDKIDYSSMPTKEQAFNGRPTTCITLQGIVVDQSLAGNLQDYELQPFPLENIDKMRQHILKMCALGDRVIIGGTETGGNTDTGYIKIAPYDTIVDTTRTAGTEVNISRNFCPLNGFAVKTYQSDLFNNWINTEWIDGENGINAITAVSTADGKFEIDALNLANKVYNMLNRIAISGGSYEDWQEAVYGEDALRRAESPVYMGGSSLEIVFDEVVSTSESETAQSGNAPLGTLAGRGVAVNKKGGKVIIKIKEPSFIIGIASITPRVDYSQGNKWFTYALDTLDDLHKPALDGIGFQELITEQMAAFGSICVGGNVQQKSCGKQPAWLNYMTSYNECHGDFAKENAAMFMTNNRRYEADISNPQTAGIKDVTTYIDPVKFNYAFADTSLTAQNFWTQIGFDVKARRKMSAKQIPNL